MVNVDKVGNRILVRSDYDPAFVEKIKQVGGGRYIGEKKSWSCPLTRLDAILKAFPNHWQEKGVQRYLEMVHRQEQLRALKEAPQPVGIVRQLLPAQRIAVNFISPLNRALLLSRGVGVGKSLCSVCWAEAQTSTNGHRGTLVVTKDAGKRPYRDEILAAKPSARIAIISGEKGILPADHCDYLVINWDIISARKEQIIAAKFLNCIFSESHKMKDPTTLRGKACLEISKAIPNILEETASFTPNRNAEAFSQLCALGHLDVKDDYWSWHVHYCTNPDPAAPKKITINRRGKTVWDLGHSNHTEELHESIKPFTYVIRREDVWPNMAMVTPVITEISNRDDYEDAEGDFIEWVREMKGDAAAERITKKVEIKRRGVVVKTIDKPMIAAKINALLEVAAIGNVKAAEEYIDTALDASEKVIVFSSFKKPLYAISKHFPALSVMITGDQDQAAKDAAREGFQKDDRVRLALCTTEAAGESITLTNATVVITINLPWSPALFSQAYGRADRFGQTRSVEVIVLIARQTYQIDQAETVYQKELNISKLITGSDRSPNGEFLRKIVEEARGELVKNLF